MKKIVGIIIVVLLVQLVASVSSAKVPDELKLQFLRKYIPAVHHWALENAYEDPNPAKLRGHVVLMKDSLPAGRAYWFITMAEYEYRPVDIINGQSKTYRGNPYVYLGRGQVMLISDVSFTSHMIYIKLLTDKRVAPEGRVEKHPSRAAVMLGFKFPSDVIANAKMDEIFKVVGEWLQPFPDATAARQFAAQMINKNDAIVDKNDLKKDKGDLPVDLALGDPFSSKGTITKKAEPKELELKAAPVATPVATTVTTPPQEKAIPKSLAVVKEGSTAEEIIKNLGEPSSKIELKDKTIFQYSDMNVVFKNGKMTDVTLR